MKPCIIHSVSILDWYLYFIGSENKASDSPSSKEAWWTIQLPAALIIIQITKEKVNKVPRFVLPVHCSSLADSVEGTYLQILHTWPFKGATFHLVVFSLIIIFNPEERLPYSSPTSQETQYYTELELV